MGSASIIIFIAFAALSTFCGADIVIQPRSVWSAEPARSPTRLRAVANFVIIHHSDNAGGCTSPAQCHRMIKSIQSDHKGRRNFSDIGYNFIVAGDGNVYEGRGFGLQGSHAPGYNSRSIGIVFLGNFENTDPPTIMVDNAKKLIAKAVRDGHLKADYTLLGHRQTKSTSCPGDRLYSEIQTWPHWRNL